MFVSFELLLSVFRITMRPRLPSGVLCFWQHPSLSSHYELILPINQLLNDAPHGFSGQKCKDFQAFVDIIAYMSGAPSLQ